VEELRPELEEAERFNDPVRPANARAERDLLGRELARAVGLGGRDRRAASHAERARLNATRAIRAAGATPAPPAPPERAPGHPRGGPHPGPRPPAARPASGRDHPDGAVLLLPPGSALLD